MFTLVLAMKMPLIEVIDDGQSKVKEETVHSEDLKPTQLVIEDVTELGKTGININEYKIRLICSCCNM